MGPAPNRDQTLAMGLLLGNADTPDWRRRTTARRAFKTAAKIHLHVLPLRMRLCSTYLPLAGATLWRFGDTGRSLSCFSHAPQEPFLHNLGYFAVRFKADQVVQFAWIGL